MPIDLVELVAPGRTAMLTMEMQRGIIGDLAVIPDLAAEVADGNVIANALGSRRPRVGLERASSTARRSSVPIGAGSSVNAPMLTRMLRKPGHLEVGSAAAQVVPELGPDPSDIISSRRHGISPFSGTDLDAILRNLGVGTILATGVSVNLGLLGLAIEAVNLGYRVAVVTDAVAGVPREYAEAVMAHTLALLATRVTVDDVINAWKV